MKASLWHDWVPIANSLGHFIHFIIYLFYLSDSSQESWPVVHFMQTVFSCWSPEKSIQMLSCGIFPLFTSFHFFFPYLTMFCL